MWCLLERSGLTSSIDITLGELYIDPLAIVVYMYVLCSVGCPNAYSYPGGLKEIPAWRVHEKDPTKVSTVSVDCNYSYNLCLIQAVLIFAASMFPAATSLLVVMTIIIFVQLSYSGFVEGCKRNATKEFAT